MRYVAILIVAVWFASIFGVAQTADELVQKNVEARGGMDKIKAIRSVRVKSRLQAGGGFTAAMGRESERPNLLRETLTLQGMTSITAYDGSAGWQVRPFGGHKDPELMGEDGLRGVTRAADFDGPLVDYKEKGNTVEYLGHDIVDGDDALRLKVTLKDGDIIYDYLDPDTFMEIREEVQEFIRGSMRESVREMGSYKPVAGVMFPYWMSEGSKADPAEQTVTVESINVNVAIDPTDFAVPASLKQGTKADAAKK